MAWRLARKTCRVNRCAEEMENREHPIFPDPYDFAYAQAVNGYAWQ
jgi:hypothetical protein